MNLISVLKARHPSIMTGSKKSDSHTSTPCQYFKDSSATITMMSIQCTLNGRLQNHTIYCTFKCWMDARHSTGNADIDDILVRHDDTEIPLPRHSQNPVVQGPQMVVDTAPADGFIELGPIAASNYTLNHLQTMALQLVCSFLDRYTVYPDSAAQHLQYTGGPGGTGKSRIIDASKDVFAARAQRHLLQITGTSGSAAARIGGTTVNSACGLDAHRSPNKPLPPFSEAKK
ncbi:hypothetical protein X797_005933 [Metarhizium robertsii]|uniref:RmlC-like jelly roll fold protein n=2 Tax=Metarhizium robertsii TaxID=568076 RepID=A0A0B2X7T6_METRA|nr:RmlC-like jelly roll fold protein [Metarhizium robertsii ARSEF 23]EXV00919.1 hypothetical protein X797_005933 [Metarhizium robertsii]KHO10973.1 RmlC-like jelly roll fold protein [Metarhizium robertsii ARSEF 23]